MSRSVACTDGASCAERDLRLMPSRLRRPIELMVRATSPSVVGDPDAIDMESAEEGWRSEDPQRRGVAARCADGVLSDPDRGAAPPARNTAARDAARSAAPTRCRYRSRPWRSTLARLSTSWTIPVVFADLARTISPPAPTPAPEATTAVRTPRVRTPASRTRSFRPVPSTTTPAATARRRAPPAPKPVAVADAVVPGAEAGAGAHRSPRRSRAPRPASRRGTARPAGTCASPSLAFGTVVTVTDLSTGASIRCTVDDREAHNPGRVVDLSPATFSQLASLSVGVIEVRLSW